MQVAYVNRLSFVKTMLFYQMNKHRVAQRLDGAGKPDQSVASGRVTKPKLQEQLTLVSRLSVVMTKLFYNMNKLFYVSLP